MKRDAIQLAAVVVLLVYGSPVLFGGTFLLYDVDFGSPPHTSGERAVAGTGPAPRKTPSFIVFGTPRVVDEFGALTDQPCRISGEGSGGQFDYTQLEFALTSHRGLETSFDRYIIEMDILIASSVGTLTILLDTPEVRNLHFEPDGTMRVFVPFGGGGMIGSYPKGQVMHLKMDVNLTTSRWEIYLDNNKLTTINLSADTLQSFRISHGKSTSGSMAIDNVTVSGVTGTNESLVGLEVYGAEIVPEMSSFQYTAKAVYSNGFDVDVTHLATWSVEPQDYAEISGDGLLAAGPLSDQPVDVSVKAVYEEDGVAVEGSKSVMISYSPLRPKEPGNPEPADGAVEVSVESKLSWSVGSDYLVINEISTGSPDMVELFNGGGLAVDLAGWRLETRDDGNLTAFTLPSYVLEPGAYVVFNELSGASGGGIVYLGGNISWSKSGDGSCALFDPTGICVDFVRWASASGGVAASDLPPATTAWVGPDIWGPSDYAHTFARDGWGTDTDSGADWENTSGVDSDVPTFGQANIGLNKSYHGAYGDPDDPQDVSAGRESANSVSDGLIDALTQSYMVRNKSGLINETVYDVYLGTDTLALMCEGISERFCDPCQLEGGRTYSWKVVARNSYGTASSPVWSFSTEIVNEPPVANAGEDNVAYGWICGTAEVVLDGSGSFDADGDELTYRWLLDGAQIASGVTATIELPAGEHLVELVVSDGWDEAWDSSIVSVVGPIETSVRMVPRALNLASQGRGVWAIMDLTEGIEDGSIDWEYGVVFEPGGVEARYKRVLGSEGKWRLYALCDRAKVIDALERAGNGEVTVVCRILSGRYLYGVDEVKLVDKKVKEENKVLIRKGVGLGRRTSAPVRERLD